MLSLVEGFFQTQLSSHLHTRFAVVFPLTFCYVSSLLMCQPRAYWLLKQWVLFFSGWHINFRFSFVLNSLAYIIIPKNTAKIKINWNEKITYNIYKHEVSLYIYALLATDIF